jgi:hypothetical protein
MGSAALQFKLREVARSGTWTTTDAITRIAGIDPAAEQAEADLGRVLALIDEGEQAVGRPLLSAVVVQRASGLPRPGFFAKARALGLHMGSDDRALWERELQRVHGYWGRR